MTKPRKGHHSTIFEMIGILGLEAAHEITGVSESLVRKWSDPDEDKEITLARALALNAACVEKNKGNPLLALLWEQAPTVSDEDEAAVDLSSATRRVTAALGELNTAIDAALSPDSPGGTQITASELRECQGALSGILLAASKLPGALIAASNAGRRR